MTGRKIRNALIAGFCGTVVHSLLMLIHSRAGPLPGFQPNEDIQQAASWIIGTEVHPAVAWLLSFVNGAIIWGFVFGQAYPFLPGSRPLLKGVSFGLISWLAMGIGFFPLIDRGLFAIKLGLGIAPALLMLVALLSYSITMSFIYDLLEKHVT